VRRAQDLATLNATQYSSLGYSSLGYGRRRAARRSLQQVRSPQPAVILRCCAPARHGTALLPDAMRMRQRGCWLWMLAAPLWNQQSTSMDRTFRAGLPCERQPQVLRALRPPRAWPGRARARQASPLPAPATAGAPGSRVQVYITLVPRADVGAAASIGAAFQEAVSSGMMADSLRVAGARPPREVPMLGPTAGVSWRAWGGWSWQLDSQVAMPS